MNISMTHWHIELSSICTLKCPRCPRAEIPETLLNNQLTLEFFQNQIGKETIQTIKKITFCGDDGDPIYAKEFLNICTWIKEVNPTIHLVIVTNGSYKNRAWWIALSMILNSYDEIMWSIDGWDQASNEQYRINCDWPSILRGLRTFTAMNNVTYTTIATIAFKFNQFHLDKIRELVLKYNIDSWQITKSTKFGSVYPDAYGEDDPLEPAIEWVSQSQKFERKIYKITNRSRPSDALRDEYLKRREEVLAAGEHPALCYVGTKGMYLKANGELYPCCWTANRYEHNKDIIAVAETRFNLNNRTLKEILADEWWSTDFKKFDNLECRTKCTLENFTEQFVTEW